MTATGSLISAPALPRQRDPAVRPYPFPARAWLCISSDPDNTLSNDWEELHRVIWQELELPFGDTAFIRSFNQNLPGQVNLVDHPHILSAHCYDGIHTWGDHMWAGGKGFHRPDAEEAAAIIERLGFRPRVWVDHSYFQGNMLHNARYGSFPVIEDRSGHAYPNPAYTLDLARAAGVRYLWDGTITPVIGQDRPLRQWALQRAQERTALHTALKLMARQLVTLADGPHDRLSNRAYRPVRFPDGMLLYTFKRHGVWEWADIDGLGLLLAPERIARLLRLGGTCIAYTHLGKRNARRKSDRQHIPEGTLKALRALREPWKAGRLVLSSTAKLLDYMVLRDHLSVDRRSNTVRFMPDGIAFTACGPDELRGHRFTFHGLRKHGLTVLGFDEPVPFTAEDHGAEGITISFP